MSSTTWELHLGHPSETEVQFLAGYFDVIRRSYPDQLDYTTDDDGLHVMVESLQILTMVFGGLDHRTTPKSLTVEFTREPFREPLRIELPWQVTD